MFQLDKGRYLIYTISKEKNKTCYQPTCVIVGLQKTKDYILSFSNKQRKLYKWIPTYQDSTESNIKLTKKQFIKKYAIKLKFA